MIRVKTREEFLRGVMLLIPVNPICVEVGVLHGDFSEQILKIVKPEKLILVDPYVTNPERRYGEGLDELPTAYSTEDDYKALLKRFYDEIWINQVIVIKKYSNEAVNHIGSTDIDFIYIDACHLYEDVKKDLVDWLPKLKPGGLMCGHDYTGNYKDYVIRAVDEFCKEYNFEMIIFNENGGDYALRRK